MMAAVLSACGTVPPTPVKQKNDPVADLSSKVQSLQRQLRERDKRIAELESQLEALKLIDQDHERQKKPFQSPTMQTPIQ
jgi:phage shock protein A